MLVNEMSALAHMVARATRAVGHHICMIVPDVRNLVIEQIDEHIPQFAEYLVEKGCTGRDVRRVFGALQRQHALRHIDTISKKRKPGLFTMKMSAEVQSCVENAIITAS